MGSDGFQGRLSSVSAFYSGLHLLLSMFLLLLMAVEITVCFKEGKFNEKNTTATSWFKSIADVRYG